MRTALRSILKMTNEQGDRLIFVPFSENSVVERRRRNLPHWSQPDCTYFVTYRLADSLPKLKLLDLQRQKANWLRMHPKPWSSAIERDFHLLFDAQMERWLDSGYGSCLLKDRAAREIVEKSLLYSNGNRFHLWSYVVMPNHVHVLVKPSAERSLVKIIQGWKSFSARNINRLLNRSGCLWMNEYFDHAVRSERQLEHFRSYIASNPLSADLPPDSFSHRDFGG
jgi:REP element-mobilizing transposase RayT